MKRLALTSHYDAPIAIALGFFDCIHRGHRLLVQTACDYACEHKGVQSALFTFSNDPSELLSRQKQIYSFEDRAVALEALGLENLIYTDFDSEFAHLKPLEFLELLVSSLNIKAIIVGSDYTFGKCAEGDVSLLSEFCKKHNINLIVKDFEQYDGKKISTSKLKDLVREGNIEVLNKLLSEPYFITGQVEHSRHVGTKLGFPTANIRIPDSRMPLASGVYATVLHTDGKQYISMTNVGAKPTFNIDSYSVEAFLLDFDGDLYGKTVKLSFVARIRDIIRFSSPDTLKQQLEKDESYVRKLIK